MKTIIQNARVIDPSQKLDQVAHLIFENGKILDLEPNLKNLPKEASTIQAKGCWLLPGLLDPHVHFREPGLEYKETIETGARAAAAGGFTAVACMANTSPVNDNANITKFIRDRAQECAACEVHPIGALSKNLAGQELAEIGGMVEAGAVALSDDGHTVMNSYLMRKAMDYAKAFDVPVITHSEDVHLVGEGVINEGIQSTALGLRGNPSCAEEIMVARDIALCRLTGCPVHIAHISTRLAIEHVKRAKEAGLPVTCEVSPHHLFLTDECLKTFDTHFKMAPPLRTQEDVDVLREALASGVVDMIATDHAPHSAVDKIKEFDLADNGIIGLQSAAPLTFRLVKEGKLSLERWVESLTTSPARLLNLPKGTLQKGVDADFILFNPDQKWKFTEAEICSKSKNSPFIDWEFEGKVKSTWVKGKKVYED